MTEQLSLPMEFKPVVRDDNSVYPKIIRLFRLGWPPGSISGHLEIDRGVVDEAIEVLDIAGIRESYESGVPAPVLVKRYNLDIQTIWGILVADRPDLEAVQTILGIEGEKLKTDDIWNFGRCFDITGVDYPGRIPGQIVINLLYYFTERGDLVIDPMAGGGTTLDACLLMNRRCFAYDKYSHELRYDIIRFDIMCEGGKLLHKADFAFLDPPYFIKKADEYNMPAIQRTIKGFMEFARSWADFLYFNMKDGGILALVMSDYIDYEDPDKSLFVDKMIVAMFERRRFKRLYKVSCPLLNSLYRGCQVNDAKRLRRLLIRNREIHIMRKDVRNEKDDG